MLAVTLMGRRMTRLRTLILTLIFFVSTNAAHGQNFNKNDFMKADFEVMSGDYEAAQRIYERLLRTDPNNANLNFLNGLCLINISGRKHEALPFLAIAATKASEHYKYGSPKEENAPLEALKHYGIALQIEGNLDKAIEMLTQYKSALPKKEKKEIELTDKILNSCYVAQRLKANPVYYSGLEQGAELKSEAAILHLVVSPDETMLFYSQSGKYGKDDIYTAKKENGIWGAPGKITTLLGVKGECYPSSVSADNSRLYLTVKSGETLEIDVSTLRKGKWQRMQSLGKPIDGKDKNSAAVESLDGEYLYFSSDRKGSYGNMDIYRAHKTGDGEWDQVENLGSVINTPDNELPLTVKDNILYFLSDDHETMGGYDVFIAEKNYSGDWNTPQNIGYPLNTADDDLSFAPLGDGIYAYKAVKGYGQGSPWAIQRLEIYSDKHPRQFTVFGTLSLEDGALPDNATVEVLNANDYSIAGSAKVDASTGWYSLQIPPGSYMINFTKPGYQTYTQQADLKQDSPDGSLSYNVTLMQEQKVEEEPVLATTEKTFTEEQPEYTEELPAYSEQPPEETNAYQSDYSASTEIYTEPEQTYTETPPSTQSATNEYTPALSSGISGKYTVQFMATLKPKDIETVLGKYQVEVQHGEDNYYRYVTGVFSSFEEGRKLQRELIDADYPTAYIRPYNINDYLENAVKETVVYTVQFLASKERTSGSRLKGIPATVESLGNDGWYRYTSGEFNSLQEAASEKEKLVGMGYSGAYVRCISSVPNYQSSGGNE